MVEAAVEPDGPIGAGSRITQIRLDGARREETRYLVEHLDPGRELRLQSLGARPVSTIGYRLAEAPEGTRITCSIRVETGGILKLVESRLRRDLERKLEATLADFKETMERR